MPEVLATLDSSAAGLTREEAGERLARVGKNAIPDAPPTSWLTLLLRQLQNPLIYVLIASAAVSAVLGQTGSAAVIGLVIAVNAAIGAAQERGAERSARALKSMVSARAHVLRGGEEYEVDAEVLVPGDVVLLESGNRVPADLRLLSVHGLDVDESLLTGESLPVHKLAEATVAPDAGLGDRATMAHSGSLVVRGRGRGIVVATGVATQVGQIARDASVTAAGVPPLLQRMASFSRVIACAVGAVVVLLGAISAAMGMPLVDVFLFSVALAVAAIPEGLPVALTIALAVASSRMAKRRVIVRTLTAVEALGSCTLVASDKTGTLTVNELTARRVALPGQGAWLVTGEGVAPSGEVQLPPDVDAGRARKAIAGLARTAALCNEGSLARREDGWVAHGDAVDVALLALAHKAGVPPRATEDAEVAAIPFEPEHRFAATLHRHDGRLVACAKGALERLLPMCTHMETIDGSVNLDREGVEGQALALADQGYRVLAVATGPVTISSGPDDFAERHLSGLTFLGLVGMIDPPRPDAHAAIEACHRAGVRVVMVTGDHPRTAVAVAKELGIVTDGAPAGEVLTGQALAALEPGPTRARAIEAARVLARVEPRQKLEVVQAFQAAGHFVAVTGDGANDAPALRAANVGVAMGRRGTDVARESGDLVLADDRFGSIVAGIEEGRVAYSNVRKVVFLLLSTGAAEVILVGLALLADLPLPLVAVQLLWLNMVTNGVQNVALAFEPSEGDELDQPPRPPAEPLFNRLMIERCFLSASVIGVVSFAAYWWMLSHGWTQAAAHNGVLLLMVLFLNIQVGNARSERRSALWLSPLKNPFLLLGTIAAQLLHIGAMYTPGLREVLGVQPVTLREWVTYLALALSAFVVVELHGLARRAGRVPGS